MSSPPRFKLVNIPHYVPRTPSCRETRGVLGILTRVPHPAALRQDGRDKADDYRTVLMYEDGITKAKNLNLIANCRRSICRAIRLVLLLLNLLCLYLYSRNVSV